MITSQTAPFLPKDFHPTHLVIEPVEVSMSPGRKSPAPSQTVSAAGRYCKTKEAAAYVCMSAWSLRKLVRNGRLKIYRNGDRSPWLFDKKDLDELIESRKEFV